MARTRSRLGKSRPEGGSSRPACRTSSRSYFPTICDQRSSSRFAGVFDGIHDRAAGGESQQKPDGAGREIAIQKQRAGAEVFGQRMTRAHGERRGSDAWLSRQERIQIRLAGGRYRMSNQASPGSVNGVRQNRGIQRKAEMFPDSQVHEFGQQFRGIVAVKRDDRQSRHRVVQAVDDRFRRRPVVNAQQHEIRFAHANRAQQLVRRRIGGQYPRHFEIGNSETTKPPVGRLRLRWGRSEYNGASQSSIGCALSCLSQSA